MRIKKAIFMLKKLFVDLKSLNLVIPIHDDEMGEELREYYIVFQSDFNKLNRLITSFDDDGIPLNKAYIDVEGVADLHYYPISIGQFGLAVFHDFLKNNNENSKKHFLSIANWFCKNATIDEKLGAYWLTEIPKPEYDVYEPWKSAFSQSRAISILLRAWQITQDEKYVQLASLALKSFDFDIDEGGVAVKRKSNQIFYEEYVASVPTRVLDGHIFSLFGLYDYVRAIPINFDAENHLFAKRLFDEGVEGLFNTIDHYDLGYWLLFNRCEIEAYPKNDPCTIGYLKLVTAQFKILHLITNNEQFKNYYLKFRRYITWGNIFRMYRTKYRSLKKLNRL